MHVLLDLGLRFGIDVEIGFDLHLCSFNSELHIPWLGFIYDAGRNRCFYPVFMSSDREQAGFAHMNRDRAPLDVDRSVFRRQAPRGAENEATDP